MGAKSLLRVQLEAQGHQPGLSGAGESRVPLIDLAQAFLFEHAQTFLHRKRDRDGGGERGHAFLPPSLGFLPVEVKAGRTSVGLLGPSAVTDANQGQPGWRHPSLLRTADRDVDSPRVGFDLDRADRAHAVDHDQAPGVASNPRKLAQRVGQTGRRLVMCEQHDLGLRMSLQDHRQVIGVDRLAPLEFEADDLRSVGTRERGESLAEVSAQRDHHLVSRRNKVGDRRL